MLCSTSAAGGFSRPTAPCLQKPSAEGASIHSAQRSPRRSGMLRHATEPAESKEVLIARSVRPTLAATRWPSSPRSLHTLRGNPVANVGADVVTTIVPSVQTQLFEMLSQLPTRRRRRARSAHRRGPRARKRTELRSQRLRCAVPLAKRRSGAPLLNRALDGLYPPGSTFKIFTAAAALDSNTVTMDSHFEDPGYLVIGDYTLHDNESEATGYGDLDDRLCALEQRRFRADRAQDGYPNLLRVPAALGDRRFAGLSAPGCSPTGYRRSRASCPANSPKWVSAKERC